jgi:hypothetical protein
VITTNPFTRACPSSTPAQPTQLDLRRADERQERAARDVVLVQPLVAFKARPNAGARRTRPTPKSLKSHQFFTNS